MTSAGSRSGEFFARSDSSGSTSRATGSGTGPVVTASDQAAAGDDIPPAVALPLTESGPAQALLPSAAVGTFLREQPAVGLGLAGSVAAAAAAGLVQARRRRAQQPAGPAWQVDRAAAEPTTLAAAHTSTSTSTRRVL